MINLFLSRKNLKREADKMIKVGIIGAGHRGRQTYGNLMKKFGCQITGVCDTDPIKLAVAKEEYNLDDEYLFLNKEDFFKRLDQDPLCNALIIATPDKDHYETVMKALDYDLDILLEKPICQTKEEAINISKKAEKSDNVLMMCYVLRYAPFYRRLKEILDSGVIGDIMSIVHNENIGYYHFAHSFVRGNWGNEKESSPLILQKSCHDMDILLYLTGSQPRSINSYGSLSYFKEGRQPKGAAARCLDCKFEETCIYSAPKFYGNLALSGWRLVVTEDKTDSGLEKALREGPYGRCVWKCDNDVCDHQAISIDFENDISAVFNLSAFSNDIHRNIKIQGTKGEIIGDDLDGEIEVNLFGSEEKTIYKKVKVNGSHGGGDEELIKAFIAAINGDSQAVKTGAQESIMSHLMCFASEKSRKENIRVDIKDYIEK